MRAEKLRELRRRRTFFREGADLFRMMLVRSVHRTQVVLEDDTEVASFSSNRHYSVIFVDSGLSFRRPVVMVEDDCDSYFHVDKPMPILQPSAC